MKRNDEFLLGFACALGTLAREHDHPTMALDIMRANGVTLVDLQEAGAVEFDLQPIRSGYGE